MSHNSNRILFFLQHPHSFRKLTRLRYSDKEYGLKGFDKTHSIFVHIPKAAGVSISKELYGNYGGGHCSIADYSNIFNEYDFTKYFKFTFVRNPWDRLLSAYRFLQEGGFNEKDEQWFELNLAKYKNFESFVMQWLSLENIDSYVHFKSQVSFLSTPNNNEITLDYLGFYENLEEDFSYIASKIKPDARLQHLNKTKKVSNFMEAYTTVMINRVADVYKQDIETFNYNFDNTNLDNQIKNRELLLKLKYKKEFGDEK